MPCLLAITDVKLMLKPVEAKVYYSTHLSLNNKGLSREAIWSVPDLGDRLYRSMQDPTSRLAGHVHVRSCLHNYILSTCTQPHLHSMQVSSAGFG